MAKQYGTLLVFKQGTGRDLIKAYIQSAIDAGLIDTNYFVDPTPDNLLREFDPQWGGPTWYIP